MNLFGGPAPRIFAAPASAAFLDVLVDAMVEALWRADDPFALSDALVLLPNRRAARGLMDAFAKKLGGAALLPVIRPLGDLDDDPDVWGPEPIALAAPPAINATRQRMELAALIRKRDAMEGGAADPARAIAMADELRRLLESAAAAETVHWRRLPTLVEDIDLARHWAGSAQFLDIVATYWPLRLQADGLADPGGRRSAVLLALAEEWTCNPPQRPVIIAGSTGSVAATRALMRVTAGLPRGVVVLPGLDSDLDDDAWTMVADQHPQFALKETLNTLGVDRRKVPALGVESETGRARRILMREALAPAAKTADWLTRLKEAGGKDFVARGAEGVMLLEAAGEDEEAAAIALLLREAFETPGSTAALVTPDVYLARRVEAKLARWGLLPIVSHGQPLREAPAGVLIDLLCDLALDACEPVALAALMKHPLAGFGLAPAALTDVRTIIEHQALRGARGYAGFAELRALDNVKAHAGALDMIARVETALSPLVAVMRDGEITLKHFAEALIASAEAVCETPDARGEMRVWRGLDGEAAAGLLQEAIEHGAELGPMPAYAAPRALRVLMQGRETPPPAGGDARIALLGPLEARLQRRDLMILGGLNEGAWPAPPPDDPFLSRGMRAALGLPSLDARIGLSAHDFAQLANAPRVVLSRALKRDGSPTVASRWLWRLETLARGAGADLKRADHALEWARALDAPDSTQAGPLRRAASPKPKPPREARLKRLSVTQVETLIRDPYAVYARRILGLEALKPIGAEPGAAERGTALHKAIEVFGEGDDPARLLELLDQRLQAAGFRYEQRAADRARLQRSVDALLPWLKARSGSRIFYEEKGALKLGGGLELSGTADRIEIDAAGAAVIVDFKSGAPPSDKEVKVGLAPQLPLEAAMLARGAFKSVPAARVHELIYWRFGGGDAAARSLDLGMSPHQAGEEALAALEKLIAIYARPEQPFLSKPRVKFTKPYVDFDHLARRKEWADAEEGEG